MVFAAAPRAVRLALAAAVGALAWVCVVGCASPTDRQPPRAHGGVIDLAGWGLVAHGAVPLEGGWHVAWSTPLEDPLPAGAPLADFAVPGRVLEHAHPASWESGTGSATFVVTLRGLDPDEHAELFVPSNPPSTLTCKSPEGATAYATLNGPRWRPGVESLAPYTLALPRARELTCMLHVRTERWAEGQHAGVWEAPVLLPLGHAARRLTAQVTTFAVLVGFLVLLATFIGVEWVLRPRERAPLFVSLMGLGAAVWLANFGHLLDGSGIPLLVRNRIEYGAIPLCTCSTMLAAELLLGAPRARRRWVTAGLGAAASVAAIVVPQPMLFGALRAAQAVSIAVAVWIVELTVRALLAKPRSGDAILLAFGLLTPALLGVGDIVITTLFDARIGLTIYGVAVLAFVLAIVLARRNARVRRAGERYAEATSRFVPAEFLRALGHDDVTTAQLGDARAQHVTVLFADIRGFTAMSESLSAAETFALLNECLSRLGPLVRAHGGFVDKYIGDAIMALFPRSPSDAVRAAIAMVAHAGDFGGRPVRLGVGVHVGEVMLGTIGEAERFEATVISDAVNLTARLEALTKPLGCSVVVSADVYARLDDDLRANARPLGSFAVKGKTRAAALYEVFANDPEPVRAAKIASRPTLAAMHDAFAAGRFERALDLAGTARDACHEDGPASWWFLRLLRDFTDDTLPLDGVVRLEEK
jgi:class 3 adenylate cyclase